MAEVIAAPEEQPNAWYELQGEEVAASLNVDHEQGLSAEEAAARLEQYGPNTFAEAKAEPRSEWDEAAAPGSVSAATTARR